LVLVENNRKFRFWLANTKKTGRIEPITPLTPISASETSTQLQYGPQNTN